MIRRVFLSLAPALLLAGAAFGQTPAKAQFEVATVKPAPPLNPQAIAAGKLHVGLNIEGSRVDIGFLSLADMIQYAYKVKPHQLVIPDWAKNQRFDILAKMPEGANKDQVPEMMQSLLAERFGLTFHKESREQPVFALVVAKGGPKLKESSVEPEAPPADDKKANVISMGGAQMRQSGNSFTVTSKEMEGSMKMTMVDGKMRMEATKAKMEMLADMVTRFVGKPVVDMTELTGKYDIAIELSMGELMNVARTAGVAVPGMPPGAAAPGGDAAGRPADAASDPGSGGTILTSLQALGLRLENRKAPVDTLIVDKLEKTPTEN